MGDLVGDGDGLGPPLAGTEGETDGVDEALDCGVGEEDSSSVSSGEGEVLGLTT